MPRIYLDTASSTPLNEQVKKTMLPFLGSNFGNPSSIHREGVAAKEALADARVSVAQGLSAQPDEIIFTSGGTEGNNLALFGAVKAWRQNVRPARSNKTNQTGHLIVSAIEHASVLAVAKELEKWGVALTVLPVDQFGVIDLKALKENLRPDTVLVSVMLANNEIGTIEPLAEIAKIIRQFKKENTRARDRADYPYFHTDACQATRFFDLKVTKLGVDLLTLNGSKMYGPKGSGVLYVRRGVKISPLIFGGGQENTLRSGTENIAGAVGLAKALELCAKLRTKEAARLSSLRDYLISKIKKEIPPAVLNGHPTERLPNNLNFTFPDVDAEWLVLNLDAKGVACSTGSACSSNTKDESYVIMALGKTKREAGSSVRFSLGRDTKRSDIDYLIKLLKQYAHSAGPTLRL